MNTMSALEYCNRETGLQLLNHSECLKFIQEHVAPDILMMRSSADDEISYHKVTKNESIRRSVKKLQLDQAPVICVFSYGPHIQKMLSILEIYKKAVCEEDENIELHQWNKLQWFVNKNNSRNELVHVCKRIPILITIFTTQEKLLTRGVHLQLKEFTKQS